MIYISYMQIYRLSFWYFYFIRGIYNTLCHSHAVGKKHVLYNLHVMAMILLGLTRKLKSAPSHRYAAMHRLDYDPPT